MIYKYYAIFEKEKDGSGINVTFPDIFGGVTCGDTFEEAFEMAKDLLITMLTSAKGQCFDPSSKKELRKKFPNMELVQIEVSI